MMNDGWQTKTMNDDDGWKMDNGAKRKEKLKE